MHWKLRFIKRSFNTNQIYQYFWFVYHRSIVKYAYTYGRNLIARLGCD